MSSFVAPRIQGMYDPFLCLEWPYIQRWLLKQVRNDEATGIATCQIPLKHSKAPRRENLKAQGEPKPPGPEHSSALRQNCRKGSRHCKIFEIPLQHTAPLLWAAACEGLARTPTAMLLPLYPLSMLFARNAAQPPGAGQKPGAWKPVLARLSAGTCFPTLQVTPRPPPLGSSCFTADEQQHDPE